MTKADAEQPSQEQQDANTALSQCMFSQYTMTLAGVGMGTGYSLYKRPKNGLGIMLVAGAAGTVGDLAYGWTFACRPYVEAYYRLQKEEQAKK